MESKLTLRALTAFMAFIVSAFCQSDPADFASNLRAQYGPPLKRETFVVPAGEMVVDYGSNDHVCRIQLPPMAPDEGRPNIRSANALDNFLLKLVPFSMRGKEMRKMQMSTGAFSLVQMTEYENVTISEVGVPRTGVTVTFKNESCPNLAAK